MVMDLSLIYLLIAWHFGGHLFQRLSYVELAQPRYIESIRVYPSVPVTGGDISYWKLLFLLLCNPVVVLHYGRISVLMCTFFYCCCLLCYLFVCYIVSLLLAIECACVAYENLKRYNRGSLFRQSIHRCRCYARDLWEGQATVPHFLHSYLLLCFLWASHSSILSQTLQWDYIAIFAVRKYLSGQHYGVFCRPISMWIVVLIGLLSDLPTSIFCIALVAETVYPTLGDDDCIAIADDGPVQAMHPGYAGDVLLDAPAQMPPDGLCLYHCIAGAANYASYMALSAADRAVLAEQLRQKAIATLREHGLSSQAERLSLSGPEGYPDEPDFLYIAMASGLSFEVAGISPGYVPH